jgi:hypothetical protein
MQDSLLSLMLAGRQGTGRRRKLCQVWHSTVPDGGTTSAPEGESSVDRRAAARRRSDPGNALVRGSVALVFIGAALWIVYAWTAYGDRYAQAAAGWQIGGTHLVEVTLLAEDRQRLACASAVTVEGLHCGYRSPKQQFDPSPVDDPHQLRPYNTVKNELFLAAGLWDSPKMPTSLPNRRFTVVCNFHVVGVLKSVSLRWELKGRFVPVQAPLAVGRLTHCEIPR